MPFLKKPLYYGLLALLTLLTIEGMAQLAHFLAFAEWHNWRPAADSVAPPVSRQNIQHPWHGYTPPASGHELNVMPPRQKRDDLVLIGLVGGSVAQAVTPHLQRALDDYSAAHNLLRRPVLLELNFQSMKQPNQLIIAAHFLLQGGHLDLIVNMDGYNEIIHPAAGYQRGIYPFFPRNWDPLVHLTAAESRLAARIARLRDEQTRHSRAAATTSPLRHTALYALWHRYRWQQIDQQIVQLHHQLAATPSPYGLEPHGPQGWFPQQSDLNPAIARVWYRSSLLLAQLAQLAGADYYHFLQPNQYVPNSKPLTAQELACCYITGGPRETLYRSLYPLLSRSGEKLQRQSISYFDLTGIFKDHKETLYADECCHLNARGNELLAAAMLQRLAPSLDRAAVAADPPAALTIAGRPAPAAAPDQLLIAAPFQVYLRAGNRLLYVKADCSPADWQAKLFLHITPSDPTLRRQHGFDNWDFQFQPGGRILNGQCSIERPLPAYPIARIHTGQYRADGSKIWAGEYRFPNPPASP